MIVWFALGFESVRSGDGFIRGVLCGGNDTARGSSVGSIEMFHFFLFFFHFFWNFESHSRHFLTGKLQVTCSTSKYSLITTRWKRTVAETYRSTASGCGVWLVPFGAAVVEPVEYKHEEVCRLQLRKEP